MLRSGFVFFEMNAYGEIFFLIDLSPEGIRKKIKELEEKKG